jgi:hypothetical protein
MTFQPLPKKHLVPLQRLRLLLHRLNRTDFLRRLKPHILDKTSRSSSFIGQPLLAELNGTKHRFYAVCNQQTLGANLSELNNLPTFGVRTGFGELQTEIGRGRFCVNSEQEERYGSF